MRLTKGREVGCRHSTVLFNYELIIGVVRQTKQSNIWFPLDVVLVDRRLLTLFKYNTWVSSQIIQPLRRTSCCCGQARICLLLFPHPRVCVYTADIRQPYIRKLLSAEVQAVNKASRRCISMGYRRKLWQIRLIPTTGNCCKKLLLGRGKECRSKLKIKNSI